MPADDLIAAYQAYLRSRSCTPRTIHSYGYHLTRADAELPYDLDCATEEELTAWLWRGQYAPASRALMYACLVGFFGWATARGHLDYDPTPGIDRPKVQPGVPRVASDELARLILTQAREPYRLWARLAAYAGARCIEIHRLDRADITQAATLLHGKGDKDRSVPTHPIVWEAVRDLPAGPIVDLPSEREVSNRFGHYCRNRWQVTFSLHRLRGWFATTAYNHTRDPRAIQILLGHSDLATTTRYIAAAVPQQRAAIDALPDFTADESAAADGAAPPTDPSAPR